MYKLTIIIPHKNSIESLKKLLSTIPFSSDIQIIIVDDHSSTDVVEQIQNLTSKESQIEIYHTTHDGAGAARNVGLQYAHGDWLLFADADDYFTDNAFHVFYKYINSNVDIVYFDVISKYSNTNQKAYRDEHIKRIAKEYQNCGNSDSLRYKHTVPWGKMIKRGLVIQHHIEFEEIAAGNDMMFSVKCGYFAKEIAYVDKTIYCVTVSSGSLTTTLSKEKFDVRFKATLRVNSFLRNIEKSRYQISVLYFIAKAKQFGWKYLFDVIALCIKNHSNLFIGLNKLFSYKKVLQDRQNPKFITRS